MKIKCLVLSAILLAGCSTDSHLRSKDPNIRLYAADLRGSGMDNLIEVQTGVTPSSLSLITVKEMRKKKAIRTLDSVSVPGRVDNIEFPDFNSIRKKYLVIYYTSKDGLYNVIVYQLSDTTNRLSKIFAAVSEYGIESDFSGISRIRIGKARAQANSPSLVPEWDTWVWAGDKFIRE